MRDRSLYAAWLRRLGVPEDQIGPVVERAGVRRAARPWPARVAAAAVEGLADWFGPALFAGTCRRAGALDDPDVDQLMHRLQASPSPAVRGAWLLVLAPLMEALLGEGEPAPPAEAHPLAAHLLAADDTLPHATDVIVIGSGAGGGPVAAQLAECGFSVMVLEAGELVTPRSAASTIEHHYVQQGMVGAAASSLTIVAAARAVGGTTPLNSGTCLRPLPAFLAEWDASVGTSFAGGELNGWLERAEARMGVGVPDAGLLSECDRLFAKGLHALCGAEAFVLPRNTPGCRGLGRCCFGCPAGGKRSVDRSFLIDAVAAGARIVRGARVERVRAGPDAVRVLVRGHERVQEVTARHVVIACGALETPALVRRSGLPATPQLGGDLRIHPTAKVFAYFPGRRPAERGIPQGMGFRPPELPRVALEGIHTPPSVAAPLLAVAGRALPWWLERREQLATFGLMVCDRRGGRVRSCAGLTWLDYALDEQDAADLVAGMRLIGKAFLAAGAERVLLPMAGGSAEFESMAQLDRLDPSSVARGRLCTVGFHPQGTAAIGRVVDHELALPGCDRVSICDTSVLPGSPGVNPQLTTMALALRHADHLARTL